MSIRKFFWVLYGAFVILLIALGFLSILLNRNQEDVKRSQEARYRSYLLVDEFRRMDQIKRAMGSINPGATQTQKGMQQVDLAAQNLNDLTMQLTSIVQQYKIG